jgi:TolA-binding protein
MTSIQERKKALETVFLQKIGQLKQLETQKNELSTEIVRLQGKLDLLKELEIENMKEKNEEQEQNAKVET